MRIILIVVLVLLGIAGCSVLIVEHTDTIPTVTNEESIPVDTQEDPTQIEVLDELQDEITDGQSQIEPAREECRQLATIKDFMQKFEAEQRELYEDAYFETDMWKAVIEGFWQGFWAEHKYCKICIANGDVPN